MTRIQVVFLFTRLANITEDVKKKVKDIVREEYSSTFGCPIDDIEISLYDGSIKGNSSDVHLFIDAEEKHYNEGVLRMEMRKAISSRFHLLFPINLGFNGVVTAADGSAPATEPEKARDVIRTVAEAAPQNDPAEVEKRAIMYEATEPKYNFDMLMLPKETIDQINRALGRIEYEKKVFDEWGLYAVMPSPVSALGFFGPPGTGKTLAAEAIASKMKKKIIRVSYADIENKYVGEGPKNVKAVFHAAEKQEAVLFIDEADSLLSKRLTNVSDGTGQAFNSMRSQLLLSLESFHGIAIFATNLVVNYDKAFLSRLISIEFQNPNVEMRRRIWETHLLPKTMNGYDLAIPLSEDVDVQELAEEFDLCGRDIRNAVVDACVEACMRGMDKVDQDCLRFGARSRCESNAAIARADDHTLVRADVKSDSSVVAGIIADEVQDKIDRGKSKTVHIDGLQAIAEDH